MIAEHVHRLSRATTRVIGQDKRHHRRRSCSDNGYATSWFGKNHNTPTYQYSTAGPFDQWPSGMGFDYFYGFMGGETDQWTPYLFREHTPDLPVGRQARLQPDHRHGRRGHQATCSEPERGRARQAVLRLLRARRHARAAPADARNGSTSSRASSTWAGTPCASRSSPTRSGSA